MTILETGNLEAIGDGQPTTAADIAALLAQGDELPPKPENDESGEAPEGESPDIKTLADLAQALEVEPEFLYSLQLTLSDTGETIPLGQLKDKIQEYQRREAEIERQTEALARERERLAQQGQQYGQRAAEVTAEMREAERQAIQAEADYARIDWEKLEQLDPGRAANERQKIMARYMAGKEAYKKAEAQAWQLQQQQLMQAKQYHDAELLKALPAWRDSEVARKAVEETIQWARGQGFSDEELSSVIPWHHRVTLYKAAQYDKLKASAGSKPPAIKPLPGGRAPASGETLKATEAAVISKARQSKDRQIKIAAAKTILSNALR